MLTILFTAAGPSTDKPAEEVKKPEESAAAEAAKPEETPAPGAPAEAAKG